MRVQSLGMKKRTEQFEFSHDGEKYIARRTITGSRKLRQTIHFRGIDENDSATYKPSEEGKMLGYAKLIAWQIASGRTLTSGR